MKKFIIIIMAFMLILVSMSTVEGGVSLSLDGTIDKTPSTYVHTNEYSPDDNHFTIFYGGDRFACYRASDYSMVRSEIMGNTHCTASAWKNNTNTYVIHHTGDTDIDLVEINWFEGTRVILLDDFYSGSGATTCSSYGVGFDYIQDDFFYCYEHTNIGRAFQYDISAGAIERQYTDGNLRGMAVSDDELKVAFYNYSAGEDTLDIYNTQTGIIVSSTGVSTFSPYNGINTVYSMFISGVHRGVMKWQNNYIYCALQNSSDNSQFCIVRINEDDLSNYTIIYDNADTTNQLTTSWWDISKDDAYLILGRIGSGAVLELFNIATQTIEGTGTDYSAGCRFSNDASHVVVCETVASQDYLIYTTSYAIDEGDRCNYAYMTSRYSKVGSLSSGCSIDIDKKTIESRYNVPVTMNITGVDLLVDISQHNDDSDMTNYFLKVNGQNMGNPECFTQYGSKYFLRWIFDIKKFIDYETILFEFKHSEKTSYGRYWQVGIGCNFNDDLNDDGDIYFRDNSHNPDGLFNGDKWNWDLAYQFYFMDIQFPDDEMDFVNDSLYVLNETHYVGNPVYMTYTLSTLATDTYVQVWDDDLSTQVNDVTFPYKCPTSTETIGFVPESASNYTVKLYRGSELESESFRVYPRLNPTCYVYTIPNPCLEFETYLVKFAYDNTDSYDGAIFISASPDYRNYFEVHYVLDGESGSFTQMQNAPCTLYYILAVNKNGTYYVVDDGVHRHDVRSKEYNNYFTLGTTHLTLIDGKASQSIFGETTNINGNCKIYDNNKLIYTISESPFNVFYTINTAGSHNVQMRLETNGTVVIYQQNYTVSGEGEEDFETPDIGEQIRNYIKGEWGDLGLLVFAFGIVIGIMLIPLYVQLKASQNQTNIEIPWVVYVIFGIVGVIVDVYIGLLPVYVILLMCIGGIACAVAVYYNRN